MSWLFLIVGITCLLALQALRNGLAVSFPSSDARISEPPEPLEFGGFDLLGATATELESLGFSGPTWLRHEEDPADGRVVQVQAVFRHDSSNTLAWVAPPMDIGQPDMLLVYYTTELADGRQAVTQVSDPYFECTDDEQTPAQTIVPAGRHNEYQSHLEFVGSLGASPASRTTSTGDILRFGRDQMNAIRARLLEKGKLRESDGITRPSIGFAARLIRKVLRRPVAASDKALAIPAARLSLFARQAAGSRDRAPSQGMQWLLLVISALLFVGIGWPIFGPQFTIIILGIVLFHEAGHWAAMRAFGYRNPHITLLPLLGGVAIGHETDPSASKRAWVSLAGPVPGIILGWFMLSSGWQWQFSDTQAEWWSTTVYLLLFINYLNVLPIPPLDGSHVLRALLPPRWTIIQIAVLFLGVLVAVYVSFLLDFWLLAIIAAMQLLFIKSMWVNAKLVRYFDRKHLPEGFDKRSNVAWVLEQLETHVGPAKKPSRRISQAQHVVNQLMMRPMGWFQRSLVSVVFAALLLVPVGAIVLSQGAGLFGDDDYYADSELMQLYENLDTRRESLLVDARSMSVDELLTNVAETDDLPDAAELVQIDAAEQRLGDKLPARLRELYDVANGLPGHHVGAVEEIRTVAATRQVEDVFSQWTGDDRLYFANAEHEFLSVDLQQTSGWWVIGQESNNESLLLLNPDVDDGSPTVYLISIDGINTAYLDIHDMLARAWVEDVAFTEYMNELELLQLRNEDRLSSLDIDELLDEIPRPGFLARLLFGGSSTSTSDPVSDEEVELLEHRIGHPLPDDYRSILDKRNRFPELFILATKDVQQAREGDSETYESLLDLIASANGTDTAFTLDDLRECWIIAGYEIGYEETGRPASPQPWTLWCPKQSADSSFLDVNSGRFHSSLTAVIRAYVAKVTMG